MGDIDEEEPGGIDREIGGIDGEEEPGGIEEKEKIGGING